MKLLLAIRTSPFVLARWEMTLEDDRSIYGVVQIAFPWKDWDEWRRIVSC